MSRSFDAILEQERAGQASSAHVLAEHEALATAEQQAAQAQRRQQMAEVAATLELKDALAPVLTQERRYSGRTIVYKPANRGFFVPRLQTLAWHLGDYSVDQPDWSHSIAATGTSYSLSDRGDLVASSGFPSFRGRQIEERNISTSWSPFWTIRSGLARLALEVGL